MPTMKKDITVNVPPETAFAYLSDITRHSEWAKHRVEIQPDSPGSLAVGSTFRSTGHDMGTNVDQVKVITLEPPRRIAFEADGGQGHFRHQFTIEPSNGGSRITKEMESLRLAMPWKLLMPVLGPFIGPPLLKGDLQRIKQRLEGTQPGPEAAAG